MKQAWVEVNIAFDRAVAMKGGPTNLKAGDLNEALLMLAEARNALRPVLSLYGLQQSSLSDQTMTMSYGFIHSRHVLACIELLERNWNSDQIEEGSSIEHMLAAAHSIASALSDGI